jgi:hypothetical protein
VCFSRNDGLRDIIVQLGHFLKHCRRLTPPPLKATSLPVPPVAKDVVQGIAIELEHMFNLPLQINVLSKKSSLVQIL